MFRFEISAKVNEFHKMPQEVQKGIIQHVNILKDSNTIKVFMRMNDVVDIITNNISAYFVSRCGINYSARVIKMSTNKIYEMLKEFKQNFVEYISHNYNYNLVTDVSNELDILVNLAMTDFDRFIICEH